MPGGLINIATYGSQDLFLTGTPEITYFKIVYRRHTNFAMESVRLKFDDSLTFNKYSTVTLPKSGDLIHKMYLEIILPEINFKRPINQNEIKIIQNKYNNLIKQYNIILCFTKINTEAYRKALEIFTYDNICNKELEMINIISETFSQNNSSNCNENTNNILIEFENILNTTIIDLNSPISNKYILCKFFYDCINLFEVTKNITPESSISCGSLINNIDTDLNAQNLKSKLDHAIKLNNYIIEYFQWLINQTNLELQDAKNNNYKFAWVKRLGHSIIEYVNIYIGGDIIDKHYGEWIDIFYELTSNKNMDDIYLKMIGDTKELTNFDRTTKPKTILYIPLIFWFNRFNGQALPLVSLQYHDVQIGVKLRKFSQVAYIENVGINFNLDDEYEDAGFQLNVNLLTDFVYLDSPERRKFAQSGHEYLIDIIQSQFEDNDIEEYKTRLDFSNPSKEIIWVIQRNSLLNNPNGTKECQWTNYSIDLTGIGNPCKKSQLFINGTKLLNKQTFDFFNYLNPYYNHTRIPADGVNSYSFALMPEENQPSGSCNLSRISLTQLLIDINSKMMFEIDNNNKNTEEPEITIVKVFSISQNILRILGGMGSLAFT